MAIDVQLVNGDLTAHTTFIRGEAVTAQRLAIRLRTLLGEWFLQPSQGIDYYTFKQTLPADPAGISATLRAEALTTPGVASIVSWAYTWDVPTRTVTINARIALDAADEDLVVTAAAPLGGTGNRLPYVAILYSSGRIAL